LLIAAEGQTQLKELPWNVTCYRRIIAGFADIAKPLPQLTEEKRTYKWFSEADAAFWFLKVSLYTTLVLGHPQPGEFIVDIDASNVEIGGVPSQIQDGQS
jgi:hypothetical protein